jgi:hypothetical protein
MSQLKQVLLTVALGVAPIACHSESSKQDNGEQSPPAGSSSAKPQDKLTRALASAIATDKSPKTTAGAKDDSGPPADGILDPAKAESQAPSHAPPKITLGSAGSEPRVALKHQNLTSPVKANLQVAIDLGGGQGLPPVDFKLELRANATKPDAKGIQTVTARIAGVSVSIPNAPADFTTQLRKLEGSKLSYRVSEDGGAFDFNQDLAKSKHQELGDLLEMVVQGLADANMAMPSDAVGAGAYWMTTSRRKSLGLDWVVYDMVKVNKVTDKDALLEISSRRYVVGRDIDMPMGAQGPKLSVREANASETAQATAAAQGSILSQYERTTSAKLLLDAADNSGQRMVQAGGQMKFRIARP